MSFLYILTHIINPHKQKIINRKEKQDSLMVIKNKERACAFTSKGSITLEAAIVVPIFFFAILSLAYLLEIMAIQTTMYNALCSVAKELAKQAYVETSVTPSEVEQRIVANIGTDRLNQSIIFGGVNGVDCGDSVFNRHTGVMDLSVQYKIEIPILMFRITPISCEETIRVKGWTGYFTGMSDGVKEDTVYVTETGLVYHRDASCTYLDMSIHPVHAEEIEKIRNQSGGKYYACESCGTKNADSAIYYITDYGTRYHTSLQCKKIQRNVYAISIEETYGLGGCSKCVK